MSFRKIKEKYHKQFSVTVGTYDETLALVVDTLLLRYNFVRVPRVHSRLNSVSANNNKRLLVKVVKTNWTHYNRPFLDTYFLLMKSKSKAARYSPRRGTPDT